MQWRQGRSLGWVNPVGTPISTQTADDTGDTYDSGEYSQFSGKKWPSIKVGNSGSRDRLPGQMEGSC